MEKDSKRKPGEANQKRNRQPTSARRAQIIEIAARVFQEKGYKAASLEDVAVELNISRPAIYHHVQSKEEILCEIHEQALTFLSNDLLRIAKEELTPEEKLHRIIIHLIRTAIEKREKVTIFFQESAQLPDKYSRRVKRKRAEYEKVIMDVIQEGIDSGVFRNVDAMMGTYAILGMCNWVYQWHNPNEHRSWSEIGTYFTDLICNGYLAKQGS